MPVLARSALLAALTLVRTVFALPAVPPSWVAKENLSIAELIGNKSETVTHYFDLTFNRTRVEDDQGGLTVAMYYPVYKEMEVDPKTMQCQKYCSLCEQGPCDDLLPLIDVRATDAGPLILDGKKYQVEQAPQTNFGGLTMESDSVYVDTYASVPLPVGRKQVISAPFFSSDVKMYVSTEWLDFRPQTFSKNEAKFAVKDVDTCQKASAAECSVLAKQFRRLRDKAVYTYARALAPVPQEVQV